MNGEKIEAYEQRFHISQISLCALFKTLVLGAVLRSFFIMKVFLINVVLITFFFQVNYLDFFNFM